MITVILTEASSVLFSEYRGRTECLRRRCDLQRQINRSISFKTIEIFNTGYTSGFIKINRFKGSFTYCTAPLIGCSGYRFFVALELLQLVSS